MPPRAATPKATRPAIKRAAGARKTTAKTTALPVGALVPQSHGGALRNGGPNKGGPGRPPNEHRDWCRQLVSDPDAEKQVAAVLKDRNHPAYSTMWKAVAERGYGKAAQPVTGADGEGPVEVIVTRRVVRSGKAA